MVFSSIAKAYAEARNIKYSPFSAHVITISTIVEIAKLQGIEFRAGDVLIIRTGLTEASEGTSEKEQATLLGTHKSVGVKSTMEAVRWMWDTDFGAVACDNVGFEAWSATKDDNGVHNMLSMVLYFSILVSILTYCNLASAFSR